MNEVIIALLHDMKRALDILPTHDSVRPYIQVSYDDIFQAAAVKIGRESLHKSLKGHE
jgi:hypothetical protein